VSERVSPKSYAVAVCLSGIFGVVGVQHFYLGRVLLGATDVGLTIGFVYCFASDDPELVVVGVILLILDVAHTLVTTIQLLIGRFRDGEGRLVCYPGQRLDTKGHY
jgi:hypothetical protein